MLCSLVLWLHSFFLSFLSEHLAAEKGENANSVKGGRVEGRKCSCVYLFVVAFLFFSTDTSQRRERDGGGFCGLLPGRKDLGCVARRKGENEGSLSSVSVSDRHHSSSAYDDGEACSFEELKESNEGLSAMGVSPLLYKG